MGKKKSKIAASLKSIVAAIKEKPAWDIDWDRVRSFDDLHEAKGKFKLILESNVGNRDEDVTLLESRESSQDADNGWCGVPDSDSNYTLGEQENEEKVIHIEQG